MGKKNDVPRFFSLPQSSKVSFKLPNKKSRQRKLSDGNSIPDDAIAPRQDYQSNFEINENSLDNRPKIYTSEQTYNYKSAWKRYEKAMDLIQNGKVLKDNNNDNNDDYKVMSDQAPNGYWKIEKKPIIPPTTETIWGRLDFGIGALDNTPQIDINNATRRFYSSRYYGYPCSTKQQAIDTIPKYFTSPVQDVVVVYELATEKTTYIPGGLKYEYAVSKLTSANDGFYIQYSSELAYFEEDTIISVNANLTPGALTRGIAVGLSKQPNYNFSSTSPDWEVGTYDYLNRGSSNLSIQIPITGGIFYNIGVSLYSQSRFRSQETISSSGSITITTPPSIYNNNNGNGNNNGDNNGGGNNNGDNNGGGNNNDGGNNNWKCNCPDGSKEKYDSPTETSGNQSPYQQWKDSNAGAIDGQCKHIWAVRILEGEVNDDEIPSDVPIEISKLQGNSNREPKIIGQQGGLGFDNWNPNKQIRIK